MQRLILICLCLFSVMTAPVGAVDPLEFRILNSYQAIKLHMADTGPDGRMVAATWLRLRNMSGEQVHKLPIVLNDGLKITSVTDQQNRRLAVSQRQVWLDGANDVPVNAALITLNSVFVRAKDIELTINYAGQVRPAAEATLAQYRAGGIKGGHTSLGFWNFAYPLPAQPRHIDLETLYRNASYYQSVTLEMPERLSLASNLDLRGKRLMDDRIELNLVGDSPLEPVTLNIGTYGTLNTATSRIHYFNGHETGAEQMQAEAKASTEILTRWLGEPPAGRIVTIADQPAGTTATEQSGLLLASLTGEQYQTAAGLQRKLATLWLPTAPPGDTGAWRDGLACMLAELVAVERGQIKNLTHLKNSQLDAVRMRLMKQPAAGHTVIDRDAATVFFYLLQDMVGQPAFLSMVRGIGQEFGTRSADMASVAGYMLDTAPNPATETLVSDWLLDGNARAAIMAAASYEALAEKSANGLALARP